MDSHILDNMAHALCNCRDAGAVKNDDSAGWAQVSADDAADLHESHSSNRAVLQSELDMREQSVFASECSLHSDAEGGKHGLAKKAPC